jgi:uncharacterized protein YecT (DUF1311 family)
MAENKVRTLSMLFVLLLAICLSMKAQSKPCGSGSHETQAEMNQCAIDEFKNADKRLNETYKELLDKLKNNKTALSKVIAAERAWIAFRDAELAARWPLAPGENPQILGSVHPFCFYEALTEMTNRRTDELRYLLFPVEGDVCGGPLAKCTIQLPDKRQFGY